MRLEITGNNHTFKKILGMWFLCLSTDWVWYFEIHISVASIHTKLPKLWWHYVEPLKSWKPKSVPVGSHVSSLLKSVVAVGPKFEVHLPPSSRIPPFVSRQFSREHMASANVSEPLGTPKPRLDIYMFNFKKKNIACPQSLRLNRSQMQLQLDDCDFAPGIVLQRSLVARKVMNGSRKVEPKKFDNPVVDHFSAEVESMLIIHCVYNYIQLLYTTYNL